MKLAKRHHDKSSEDIYVELLDQFYVDDMDIEDADADMIVSLIEDHIWGDCHDSAAAVALIALLLDVSQPEIMDVLFREQNGAVRFTTTQRQPTQRRGLFDR